MLTIFGAVLLLISLACTCFGSTAIGQTPPPNAVTVETATEVFIEDEPTDVVDEPTEPSGDGGNFDTEFPVPDDAQNFTNAAGNVNFQTEMSIDDVLAYYRDAFTSQGYTERDLLTAITDTTFSIVFDGHESGDAIVVQAVDLGNGTTNVNIRLEDV
jgi:hypothetical protein